MRVGDLHGSVLVLLFISRDYEECNHLINTHTCERLTYHLSLTHTHTHTRAHLFF